MAYLTPSGYGLGELTEKRSRFIGEVWPIETESAAKAQLDAVKSAHHDARHHCWCYILRAGTVVRYSDDGEPQGSAGLPMLEVFRRGGIENVLCVVTRYFGGILLGTGGLTRAYSKAAKLALDAAGIAGMRQMAVVELACPYHLFDRIKIEIEVFSGHMDSAQYGADIAITAAFTEDKAPLFLIRLSDVTAGAVTGHITGRREMAVEISAIEG
ncbi:YigZ family protein [Oscillospiraceae bacterium WX1]